MDFFKNHSCSFSVYDINCIYILFSVCVFPQVILNTNMLGMIVGKSKRGGPALPWRCLLPGWPCSVTSTVGKWRQSCGALHTIWREAPEQPSGVGRPWRPHVPLPQQVGKAWISTQIFLIAHSLLAFLGFFFLDCIFNVTSEIIYNGE